MMFLIASVVPIAGTEAAVGDCLTRLWGGANQETTYSPPYPQDVEVTNRGLVSPQAQPFVAPSNQAYLTASPLKTEMVQPTTYQQVTAMQPEVSKEWSYSRIKSVQYKPVQSIDPYTGNVSTTYRAEESQSLLPWLHQKEVVRYQPVTVNVPVAPVPVVPSSTVVRANYAGPVSGTVSQVGYSAGYSYNPCDPCATMITNPCGGYIETIPPQPVDGTGEFSQGAASTSSTVIGPNLGRTNRSSGPIPNYGTPGMISSDETSNGSYAPIAPSSAAADQVPVVQRSESRKVVSEFEIVEPAAQPLLTVAVVESGTGIKPLRPLPDVLGSESKQVAEKKPTDSADELDPELAKKQPEPVRAKPLVQSPAPAAPAPKKDPLVIGLPETDDTVAKPTVAPTRIPLKYYPLGFTN